jgi:hypothetical protein
MAGTGIPMQITPVDEYNNLFEITDIVSHDLMEKILSTPWLDLPWSRQEGQEHWFRRRISNDSIPWTNEWNDHINKMWPKVGEAIGRKLEISYGSTWWIDEPEFTCDMHTDGDLKGAMQIICIAAHKQLGTCFYHDKNGTQVRKQFLSIPNTGYVMLNFPRKNGLTHLHWHAMSCKVPPGTFRLSSYTLLTPSKQ